MRRGPGDEGKCGYGDKRDGGEVLMEVGVVQVEVEEKQL